MTDPNLTPPPELVKQWLTSETHDGELDVHIANQAAQWAADRELEACCEWIAHWCPRGNDGSRPEDHLRAHRRPKPPSQKALALARLDAIEDYAKAIDADIPDVRPIRDILEALPDD